MRQIAKIMEIPSGIQLKLSKEDSDIVRNEFFRSNIQRGKLFLLLATPISLAHIIVFYFKVADGVIDTEYLWAKGIIMMHSFVIVLAITVGIYSILAGRQRKKATRFDLLTGPVFSLLVMVIGVLTAGIDQRVTEAYTPFVVGCIVTPLVFLIRPVAQIVICLIVYPFFIFVMSNSMADADALLSVKANALSFIGLTIFLNILLWKSGINQKRQDRLINRQKIALEESNLKLSENASELEGLNATKDRFFSIIAHDLYGPVSAISSYIQLVDQEVKSGNFDREAVGIRLGRMIDSVDNTLKLIKNLLAWAKSQRTEIVFNPKPLNPVPLVQQSIEYLKPQSEKKRIAVEVYAGDEPIEIHGDANMLETIFRNLISNAIKFSFPGSKIRISIRKNNEFVVFGVADQGVGINPDILSRLFQLDGGISSYGTDHEAGTGLGLILCQEFINHHKGSIKVESEVGKGSTFWVEVPI